VNSADVTTTGAAELRPWNVDTSYKFQRSTTSVDGLHSSASFAAHARQRQVTLRVDPRVLEGRRLTENDARESGPVSEDVLNEVRSRWPD
jgi:hypothetical protein